MSDRNLLNKIYFKLKGSNDISLLFTVIAVIPKIYAGIMLHCNLISTDNALLCTSEDQGMDRWTHAQDDGVCLKFDIMYDVPDAIRLYGLVVRCEGWAVSGQIMLHKV